MGNPLALLVGMQTGAAALENNVETLRPSNTTTRNLPKGYRSANSQGHMYPNVDSSAVNYGKSPNVHQLMDKEDVVYICNGILLGNEKE